MVRIGYVRASDRAPITDLASEISTQVAAMEALGCHVVRAEEPVPPFGADFTTLNSILEFISNGDELVVGRLEHLGGGGAMLAALKRLEGRGAVLRVVDPKLSSKGAGGRVLRAVLEAVATAEQPSRARRPAANQDIRALRRAGVGPVEIARRLGVSRMTVWRKLKAMDAGSPAQA